MAATLVLNSGNLRDTVQLFLAQRKYGEVRSLCVVFGSHGAKTRAAYAAHVAAAFKAPHASVDCGHLAPPRAQHFPVNHNTVEEARAAKPLDPLGRNAALEAAAYAYAVNNGLPRLVTGALPGAAAFKLPEGETEILVEDLLAGKSLADVVKIAKEDPECWAAVALSYDCECGGALPSPHNRRSLLRAAAFREAGLPDPSILRHKAAKRLPADYPDDGYAPGTKYALIPPPAKPQPAPGFPRKA